MQNAWRELALKGEKLDWGKMIMRAQLEVIGGGRKA